MLVSEYYSSIRYKNSIRPIYIGDLVRITRMGTQSYGMVGEVVGFENQLVLVKFREWHGEINKILRFTGESMRLVGGTSRRSSDDNSENVEERDMANNSVTGNYDIAWVRFPNGQDKEYAFALFDSSIEAGDYVLVDCSGEFKCTKVSSVIKREEFNGDLPTKEVVCKVDLSEFEARKEIREQKKTLRRKMDAILAKNQELILYKAIAKENPEMAAMLEAYEALGDDV